MNPNYIIIQAGGKGTRMEHLTANKPKALVPIGNRPVLFHLFEQYPDKKYIIIGDYKCDVLKKYLHAFAKVKYLVTDTYGKKGTCSGIRDALKRIPENEAFMLIWSDLVLPPDFAFPEEEDNYVGVARDFSCRWSYEEGIFEETPSDTVGVAGLFLFKDKKRLRDIPDEGELVKWMKSQGKAYRTFALYKTKEYGLVSEWDKINCRGIETRCRPFNKMTVLQDFVIKESIDSQGKALAVREKAWYRFVIESGYTEIPQIYSYEPFKMQRIKGKNVYEYQLALEQKKPIVDRLVHSLKKLHDLETAPTDYFSLYEAYVGKTLKRLEKIRDLVPFTNEPFITVNGRKCRNVFFFQDELKTRFMDYACREFKFLHGDNTFSNIMLDEGLNPILIDPRGYFGYTELYGDVAYDWAKLYYSIVGNYDQFNLKHFTLTIHENLVELAIDSNGWEDVADYYIGLIADEVDADSIKLIHAVIWLSLTTYAWEDYDSICGAFYNGLYYLEEIM